MNVELIAEQGTQARALRQLHRQEMNCQIILDSWSERGWVDARLLRVDGRIAGYVLLGGAGAAVELRDAVIEYYVLPCFRQHALAIFHESLTVARVRKIQAQSNDRLLTAMLFDCAARIEIGPVLFHDDRATTLAFPGAFFRAIGESERSGIFAHTREPVGDWGIELEGAIVATGGYLLHYNMPFADLYIEVAAPFHRRGCGSYLVQELKRACYETGKIPAARCAADNVASRATLQRAGMSPCARVLTGYLDA